MEGGRQRRQAVVSVSPFCEDSKIALNGTCKDFFSGGRHFAFDGGEDGSVKPVSDVMTGQAFSLGNLNDDGFGLFEGDGAGKGSGSLLKHPGHGCEGGGIPHGVGVSHQFSIIIDDKDVIKPPFEPCVI